MQRCEQIPRKRKNMALPEPEHEITILYAEDETATMEQVNRMLAFQGYRLILAETGGTALSCSGSIRRTSY